MASRRDIREAFYNDLETAASGHVQASNITQEFPEKDEDLPAIVHNDAYRDVPMNNGTGPVDVTKSGSTIQAVTWSGTKEAQFSVTILAADEQTKEDAYEAVVTYFEAYEHPTKDHTDLHADVFDITVGDTNSNDTQDREPQMRGDALTIGVSYERYFSLIKNGSGISAPNVIGTFENIDSVDHLVDVGDDGTTDETYTTT